MTVPRLSCRRRAIAWTSTFMVILALSQPGC
jgi:hypothetical protein